MKEGPDLSIDESWSLRAVWRDLRIGHWHCGCEFYEGKPMLAAGRLYYDWWWYYLHVGPFWVSVDPY